ncbi:MAG: hypothetical protein M3Y65_18985 [Pseudomonadota bacterium]|nr:hypothetical protein [Pseudomonadota bacterium]
MNTATVTPILVPPLTVVPHPQVLTREMVEKITAVNRTVRWLRMHRHQVLSISLTGFRPTLVVDAAAAALLVEVGRGKSTFRRRGEAPLHCVVVDGCRVEWAGSETPA